jgi:Sugar phosphate isomerases/epimerases
MTDWPIGLSTGCFYHQSILDCLSVIRESGFSTIEICSSPTHLDYHDPAMVRRAAERIHELGMEAYSFHAPFADNIDIAASDDARRDAALAEVLQAAEAAAVLRVHYFVIHPGPEHPAETSGDEQLARMRNVVATLNQVARRCRELGIMCVLENKLPHLLFGNTSDILWILDAISAAEVGACLDTGHAFLSGDMQPLIKKLRGHLKMVHAHDNRGMQDDHFPPGDGRIDWEAMLHDLMNIEFRGALMLEMAGQSDANITMANARRGRQYLREMSRRIALLSLGGDHGGSPPPILRETS